MTYSDRLGDRYTGLGAQGLGPPPPFFKGGGGVNFDYLKKLKSEILKKGGGSMVQG